MPDVRQFLGADGLPKYFLSQEKALAFIEKRKAGDTHEVKLVDGKFLIVPKEVV